jgi:hypothetical protein
MSLAKPYEASLIKKNKKKTKACNASFFLSSPQTSDEQGIVAYLFIDSKSQALYFLHQFQP